MWFSAIKLAVSAGSKIYANKQKAKMAMSDAQLLHAERQARGEEAYQGKLLEARQSDWKDCDGQGKIVLRHVLPAPVMVHQFVDPCRGEYLWYKGDTNF